MEKLGLLEALQDYLNLEDRSFSVFMQEINGGSVKIFRFENKWNIVLLEHSSSPIIHLVNFESAMQFVIIQRENQLTINNLALAIDFDAIAKKQKNSYRKVLKKYSRSVVFTDLDMQLLVFMRGKILRRIDSTEINNFLIDLDRQIEELYIE